MSTADLVEREAISDGVAGAEAAVRIAPKDAGAWKQLAESLAEEDRVRFASLIDYASRKSVLLAPDRVEYWHARGRYLQVEKRLEDLLGFFPKALTHHPSDPDLLSTFARHLRDDQRYGEAVRQYELILEHHTDRQSRVHHEAVLGVHACLTELGQPERATARMLGAKQIPPRPQDTDGSCVDLTVFYNSALDEPWHNRDWAGNDLAKLTGSPALRKLPQFDLRGVIQLGGKKLNAGEPGFLDEALGIRIDRTASVLHFLHGAAWGNATKEGTHIAVYRVRYADGQTVEIPVITKENIDEWHAGSQEDQDLPGANVVSLGANAGGANVRLYHFEWKNLHPQIAIESIDFVSELTDAAPFLVGLTTEP